MTPVRIDLERPLLLVLRIEIAFELSKNLRLCISWIVIGNVKAENAIVHSVLKTTIFGPYNRHVPMISLRISIMSVGKRYDGILLLQSSQCVAPCRPEHGIGMLGKRISHIKPLQGPLVQ